jgi:hypothetical protein
LCSGCEGHAQNHEKPPCQRQINMAFLSLIGTLTKFIRFNANIFSIIYIFGYHIQNSAR